MEQTAICNTYPWKCVSTCGKEKQYMPIQSMGSEIYGYIFKITLVHLSHHMTDKMPKAICKDEFNEIVNECMCELTEHEKEFKNMLKNRCTEYEEELRGFCSNCNGLLKSVVEVALITSLMNGGCIFCY